MHLIFPISWSNDWGSPYLMIWYNCSKMELRSRLIVTKLRGKCRMPMLGDYVGSLGRCQTELGCHSIRREMCTSLPRLLS